MSQYNPLWTGAGKFVASFCLVTLLASSASAADLIGHYKFENNINDSTSNANNGTGSTAGYAAGVNGGQAALFSGGAHVNVPININAPTSFTIGAWVNPTDNTDSAIFGQDNGGWDRGVDAVGGTWHVASNPNASSGFTADLNTFQFVTARFDGANVALFKDGAVNSAVATNNAGGGNTTLGIGGLYPNPNNTHAFSGLIDEFFVFGGGLSDGEIFAIRNLSLDPTLQYDPSQADQLFDVFDGTNATGEVEIDGLTWSHDASAELLAAAPNAGDVGFNNGQFFLNIGGTTGLATAGAGQTVPEPASIAIWSLLGLCLAGYGYRRQRRQS